MSEIQTQASTRFYRDIYPSCTDAQRLRFSKKELKVYEYIDITPVERQFAMDFYSQYDV